MNYVIMIAAGLLGYWVISKTFDYFKKGSTWERSEPPQPPKRDDSKAPPESMDEIRKRQAQQHRDWRKRD